VHVSDHLLAYLIAVAAITASPGPDTVLVVNRAVLSGRRLALMTACGSATGLLVWGTASAVGIAALVAASATAFTALKLLGAAYLVYLGVRLLWQSRPRATMSALRPPLKRAACSGVGAFRQGLLTNLFNPKAGAFFTALLPQFVGSGQGATTVFFAYAAIASGASLAGLSFYAWLAYQARTVLSRGAIRAWFDRATGCVLVALGVRLALERSR
jgi:threonine/homoserine/homoserine lactone efflux protein